MQVIDAKTFRTREDYTIFHEILSDGSLSELRILHGFWGGDEYAYSSLDININADLGKCYADVMKDLKHGDFIGSNIYHAGDNPTSSIWDYDSQRFIIYTNSEVKALLEIFIRCLDRGVWR